MFLRELYFFGRVPIGSPEGSSNVVNSYVQYSFQEPKFLSNYSEGTCDINKNRKICFISNLQNKCWYSLCAVQELRYAELAEDLQRNLTFLHKRTAGLAKDLQKHHRMIWDQINEIRRIEVMHFIF